MGSEQRTRDDMGSCAMCGAERGILPEVKTAKKIQGYF